MIEEGPRDRALWERAALLPDPHDLDLHLAAAAGRPRGAEVVTWGIDTRIQR